MDRVLFQFPGSDSCSEISGILQPIDRWPSEPGFIIRDHSGTCYRIEGNAKPCSGQPITAPHQPNPVNTVHNRESYTAFIAKTQQHIRDRSMQKIVVSRRIPMPYTRPVSDIWNRLCASFPDAFCVYLQSESTGNWIGASPEILLQYNGNRFTTYSLAGTAVKPEDFGAKEKREQQLVTQHIMEVIAPLASSVSQSEVRPVKAGNIWHLRTDIHFCMAPVHIPELLDQLHPTPAIAGTPTPGALKWIREQEAGERKLYTGYWGYITPESGKIFVNLRCAEVFSHTCIYYVGGGIIAESDPGSEWQETVDKSTRFREIIEG